MDIQSMTPIQQWLYAGACVLLPVVWGLVIVGATDRVERVVARRRTPHHGPGESPPQPPTLEYHI
jgi:hypothetical protein